MIVVWNFFKKTGIGIWNRWNRLLDTWFEEGNPKRILAHVVAALTLAFICLFLTSLISASSGALHIVREYGEVILWLVGIFLVGGYLMHPIRSSEWATKLIPIPENPVRKWVRLGIINVARFFVWCAFLIPCSVLALRWPVPWPALMIGLVIIVPSLVLLTEKQELIGKTLTRIVVLYFAAVYLPLLCLPFLGHLGSHEFKFTGTQIQGGETLLNVEIDGKPSVIETGPVIPLRFLYGGETLKVLEHQEGKWFEAWTTWGRFAPLHWYPKLITVPVPQGAEGHGWETLFLPWNLFCTLVITSLFLAVLWVSVWISAVRTVMATFINWAGATCVWLAKGALKVFLIIVVGKKAAATVSSDDGSTQTEQV